MNKILIIGQAPPAVKQGVPYDTTMLYEWLAECDISKEQAQNLFEFEAVGPSFPGFAENGGHKPPTQAQMDTHWHAQLRHKAAMAERVLVLGRVASDYLHEKLDNKTALFLPHPSRRNYSLYMKNRDKILSSLHLFLSTTTNTKP